jgi:hypothetical protein
MQMGAIKNLHSISRTSMTKLSIGRDTSGLLGNRSALVMAHVEALDIGFTWDAEL